MAQLSQANIKTVQEAVKAGLMSSSMASLLYERSAKGQTSLRDLQFILSLIRSLQAKKGKKK